MWNKLKEFGKGLAIAGAGTWGIGGLANSALLSTLGPWGLGIGAVTWGASKAIGSVFSGKKK